MQHIDFIKLSDKRCASTGFHGSSWPWCSDHHLRRHGLAAAGIALPLISKGDGGRFPLNAGRAELGPVRYC